MAWQTLSLLSRCLGFQTARPRASRRPVRLGFLEQLESRLLLATYRWVGLGGDTGAWNNTSSWINTTTQQPGVPGPNDFALIDTSTEPLTIFVPAGAEVKDLTVRRPVTLANGSLTASSSADFLGATTEFQNFALTTGAFIVRGDFTQTGGSLTVGIPSFWKTATISGITFSAERLYLDDTISLTNSELTIAGTISAPDAVTLSNTYIHANRLELGSGAEFVVTAPTNTNPGLFFTDSVTMEAGTLLDLGETPGAALEIGQKLTMLGGELRLRNGFVGIGSLQPFSETTEGTLRIRPNGEADLRNGAVIDAVAVFIDSEPLRVLPFIDRDHGTLSVTGFAKFTGELTNAGQMILYKTGAEISGQSRGEVLQVSTHFEQTLQGIYYANGADTGETLSPWLLVIWPGLQPHGIAMATADIAGYMGLPEVPVSQLGGSGAPIPKPRQVKWGPLIEVEGICLGRFDEIDGRIRSSSQELNQDRFLGVQYPSSSDSPFLNRVQVMFLEVPRLLVNRDGVWTQMQSDVPEDYNRLLGANLVFPGIPMPASGPKKNLILIAPGTAANIENWPIDVAKAIAANSVIDADIVLMEWKEWNTGNEADLVHGKNDWEPFIGSELAIDIGAALGQWLWLMQDLYTALSGQEYHYDYVHLISHSGGSWLVDSLADTLKTLPETKATLYGRHEEINWPAPAPYVHLTLFDAFNPNGAGNWGYRSLAGLFQFEQSTLHIPGLRTAPELGDHADYADHFFDSRRVYWKAGVVPLPFRWAAVGMTDDLLPNFFNVDVTNLDPEFAEATPEVTMAEAQSEAGSPVLQQSHAWPRKYYLATIGNTAAHQALDQFLAYHYTLEAQGEAHRPEFDEIHIQGNDPAAQISADPIGPWVKLLMEQSSASVTGNATVAVEAGINAVLTSLPDSPAGVTATFNLTGVTDMLRLSVMFPPTALVTLQILFDGRDLGTIDRTPLNLYGMYSAIADLEIDLGPGVTAGVHTLQLIARTTEDDEAALTTVVIGPLSFHQAADTPEPDPVPTLEEPAVKAKTKNGKTKASVALTFSTAVTLETGGIEVRDQNNAVVAVKPKVTHKKGKTTVKFKAAGSGPLILKIDGGKIKGANNAQVDADGDGLGGGLKTVQLG